MTLEFACYGDSISAGSPIPAAQTYINKAVADFPGANLTNHATSGAMAADESYMTNMYKPQDITVLMFGTNDTAVNGVSTPRLNNYIDVQRAMTVFHGNANIVSARNMTKTGTWSNQSASGSTLGTFTTDMNATSTATVHGPVIYLSYLQFSVSCNSVFEVYVDSVLIDSITLNCAPLANTGLGNVYASVCKRYTGFTDADHVVKIVNKTTAASLNLEWVGSTGPLFIKKPVFIVNTPFKASYSGTDSAANVTAYVTALNTMVSELVTDGFNVHVIDANSLISTSTDLVDPVHPNVGGHVKIYNSLKTAINTYAIPAGSSPPVYPTGPFSITLPTPVSYTTVSGTWDGAGHVSGALTIS